MLIYLHFMNISCHQRFMFHFPSICCFCLFVASLSKEMKEPLKETFVIRSNKDVSVTLVTVEAHLRSVSVIHHVSVRQSSS